MTKRTGSARPVVKNSTQSNQRNHRRNSGRKTSFFYKVVAAIVIIAIIGGGGYAVKNFSTSGENYKTGLEAMEVGNYPQAVACFSKALEGDSRNRTYRQALGTAQIENLQYDDAVATFQTMTESSTATSKQYGYRGMGIAYLYKSDYANAVDALTQALSYASSKYSDIEIDIAYYLADAQMRNDDPVGAVLTYTKIIDQKADADAYMLRGMAYQAVGDNTNAEADLVTAIDKSKKSYKVYMALYQTYLAQGKENEANKLLQEATQLSAKTAEDYSNRGLLWMYMKSYDNAAADLDVAIDKEYVPAYFGKAQLCMEQGLYEKAVEMFNAYFAKEKTNALAYNQYGVCMMQLGRYAEAADAFSQGLALNDRTIDQEIRFNEVTAYEHLGDWTTAMEKAQAYVERYPDDAVGQKELTFIQSRQY